MMMLTNKALNICGSFLYYASTVYAAWQIDSVQTGKTVMGFANVVRTSIFSKNLLELLLLVGNVAAPIVQTSDCVHWIKYRLHCICKVLTIKCDLTV